MVDVEDRATFVNQRMADLLGYTVEEMLGRSPSEFYFSDAGRQERDEHRKRSREGIRESREVVYRRHDGEPLWAVVATTPILRDGNRLEGILGMVTDITARVKAEENEPRPRLRVVHGQHVTRPENGDLRAVRSAMVGAETGLRPPASAPGQSALIGVLSGRRIGAHHQVPIKAAPTRG
jgi:PAS domain S-box-containing protein